MFKGLKTITLVAIVAFISLFGIGYAAWTFSGGASTETSVTVGGLGSSTSGGSSTDVEYAGNLEITTDEFYLVLDQSFLGFASTEDATSADVTYITLAYNGSDVTDLDETIDFVATGELVLTGPIADYIQFNDDAYFTGNVDEYEFTYEGDEVKFDYYLPTVSWIEGMKPTNEADYNTMVEALAESTITFKFAAELAD